MSRSAKILWALLLSIGSLQPRTGHAQGTPSPHGRLSAGLECRTCHTNDAWTPLRSPIEFDHAQTRFPLLGAHRDVGCKSCHLDLRFDEPQLAVSECGSCHLDVHQGRLSAECSSCHTATTFADVEALAIHNQTSFALTGSHAQIACESCHSDDRGGAFVPLNPECMTCHEEDYVEAVIIDHVASGFPTECAQCHSTLSWRGAEFDHLAASGGFVLVGSHASVACEGCHVIPGLEPIFDAADQNDCFACHESDYRDEHDNSAFPTTCLSCHNTNDWDDASFDHGLVAGGFNLVGAHTTVACESCHTVPGYDPIFNAADQNDCYACHTGDYEDAHAGSGYPTTCTTCHTPDSWETSPFDHDRQFFPIYSGNHEGKWTDCQTCHVQPSDFQVFSCTTCHEHNRIDTDKDHREVSGYAYESMLCYSCHENGD